MRAEPTRSNSSQSDHGRQLRANGHGHSLSYASTAEKPKISSKIIAGVTTNNPLSVRRLWDKLEGMYCRASARDTWASPAKPKESI